MTPSPRLSALCQAVGDLPSSGNKGQVPSLPAQSGRERGRVLHPEGRGGGHGFWTQNCRLGRHLTRSVSGGDLGSGGEVETLTGETNVERLGCGKAGWRASLVQKTKRRLRLHPCFRGHHCFHSIFGTRKKKRNSYASKRRKRMTGPLELQLQVSYPKWMLGTESGSSPRATAPALAPESMFDEHRKARGLRQTSKGFCWRSQRKASAGSLLA